MSTSKKLILSIAESLADSIEPPPLTDTAGPFLNKTSPSRAPKLNGMRDFFRKLKSPGTLMRSWSSRREFKSRQRILPKYSRGMESLIYRNPWLEEALRAPRYRYPARAA